MEETTIAVPYCTLSQKAFTIWLLLSDNELTHHLGASTAKIHSITYRELVRSAVGKNPNPDSSGYRREHGTGRLITNP